MNAVQWQKSSSSSKDPSPKSASSKHSSNIWFPVSLGLIGVIVGYTIGNWTQVTGSLALDPNGVPSVQEDQQSSPPRYEDMPAVDFTKDHFKGNTDADIALVEYTDYECPYCRSAHPTLEQLEADYGGKVVWVLRQFPLTSIHPNALPAAEASECVAELGGNDSFWTFTNAVMTQQDAFGKLPELAQTAGVDGAVFTACIESGKYKQEIQDESAAGSAAGVQGTPATFVVNLKTQETQFVSGAQSYEGFKSVIDSMLL
ncbi:MAG: thioredoxin domain-containing protein [Candidatus Peribacteraceae bacterium]|jgi:protein-disulfide isomerase